MKPKKTKESGADVAKEVQKEVNNTWAMMPAVHAQMQQMAAAQVQQNDEINQLELAMRVLIVCQQSEKLWETLDQEGILAEALGIVKYRLKNGPVKVKHIDETT